jgi:mannobiose 2-epimerase
VIDSFGHDSQWGGYRECFTRDWTPASQLADSGARGDQKTVNTHLHLIEAFATLYRASSDAAVKGRLEELIDLCLKSIIHPTTGRTRKFFEPDRTPLPGAISFGHGIDRSWLLTAAAEACGAGDTIAIRETSFTLAKAVARDGLDRRNGGLFYRADETGRRIDRKKVWWVQAEALVGS